jgi:NAD(P)H-nitrite reductase large subunit
LWYNHAIVRAEGDDHVRRATIARLDESGAPIPGAENSFEVDAVCLGYGLLPSFQLAAAFGCKLRFDAPLGWYTPAHNRHMETSRPAIAGAKVALLQGKIAGLNVAYQLGFISKEILAERLAPLFSRLEKLDRLSDALQQIYAYRPGLAKAATDDTLLCRCEEITLGKVKQALADGAVDVNQVKLSTRAGMGYCQGRFCSALIAPWVAEATGRPLSDLLPFTVRPPLQPIPLRVLAAGILEDIAQ